jgi:hypothetical protein
LIGTYDSDTPPAPGDRILRFAALVHLSRVGNGRTLNRLSRKFRGNHKM